jgi:hypothetical protein
VKGVPLPQPTSSSQEEADNAQTFELLEADLLRAAHAARRSDELHEVLWGVDLVGAANDAAFFTVESVSLRHIRLQLRVHRELTLPVPPSEVVDRRPSREQLFRYYVPARSSYPWIEASISGSEYTSSFGTPCSRMYLCASTGRRSTGR